MSVQENTINILHELESNALKIDDAQAAQFISQIRNARHIFCRVLVAVALLFALLLIACCI